MYSRKCKKKKKNFGNPSKGGLGTGPIGPRDREERRRGISKYCDGCAGGSIPSPERYVARSIILPNLPTRRSAPSPGLKTIDPSGGILDSRWVVVDFADISWSGGNLHWPRALHDQPINNQSGLWSWKDSSTCARNVEDSEGIALSEVGVMEFFVFSFFLCF